MTKQITRPQTKTTKHRLLANSSIHLIVLYHSFHAISAKDACSPVVHLIRLRCRLTTVSAKGGDPSLQHRDRLPAEAFGCSSPQVGQFRGGAEFSPLGGCSAGPAPGESIWLARLVGLG